MWNTWSPVSGLQYGFSGIAGGAEQFRLVGALESYSRSIARKIPSARVVPVSCRADCVAPGRGERAATRDIDTGVDDGADLRRAGIAEPFGLAGRAV